jgi:hypothetical protein
MWFKSSLMLMVLFTISSISIAQEKRTINGCFINEDFEPLPYVKIYHSDTVCLGETDLNGRIIIEVPNNVVQLKIIYIGYNTTEIELFPDCHNLDVILLVHVIYDFIPNRKVQKKERKRLKRLSRLHRKAFKQGIFKSKKQCYQRIMN